MNKVKKFIQDNKKEMKVLVYGVGMLAAGVCIGRKYENIKLNNFIDNLARTEKVVTNFVDGKKYMLSVTQIEK